MSSIQSGTTIGLSLTLVCHTSPCGPEPQQSLAWKIRLNNSELHVICHPWTKQSFVIYPKAFSKCSCFHHLYSSVKLGSCRRWTQQFWLLQAVFWHVTLLLKELKGQILRFLFGKVKSKKASLVRTQVLVLFYHKKRYCQSKSTWN